MPSKYPWDQYDPKELKDFAYLMTEAGRARSRLASHYLKDCENILEIGGFKTPITPYLIGPHKRVLSIDPKGEEYESPELNGHPCEVRHVVDRFQNIEINMKPYSYGLVLIGCSLKFKESKDNVGKDEAMEMLQFLVNKAQLTVLEFAGTWPNAQENIANLLENTRTEVVTQFEWDLLLPEGDDKPFSRRVFLILKPSQPVLYV